MKYQSVARRSVGNHRAINLIIDSRTLSSCAIGYVTWSAPIIPSSAEEISACGEMAC